MHDREIDELLKRLEEEEDGNLSRRDLLKRGAALGAGLAAFSVCRLRGRAQRWRQPKAAVKRSGHSLR